MDLEKAIVTSPTGQFSALVGELKIQMIDLESQNSEYSETMEDYWNFFIAIQT